MVAVKTRNGNQSFHWMCWKHNEKVNDIAYAKGVSGHHVFVNSELGLYIDHFKGDRKDAKSSRANDIRKSPSIAKLDYWKNKWK